MERRTRVMVNQTGSGHSQHAVSLGRGLWSPAGLQGAHKCHWINLPRLYDVSAACVVVRPPQRVCASS